MPVWKVIFSLCWISSLTILVNTGGIAKSAQTLTVYKPQQLALDSTVISGRVKGQADPVNPSPIYFPLIFAPDPFLKNLPIWAHTGTPAAHEVALFRHTFDLPSKLSDARLAIFTDTRYQAWLEGIYIGRGPARFSPTFREYDVLELGDLLPGSHTLSVLVQWAPNNRRSESVSPFLQAHIEGEAHGQYTLVAQTGPEWRTTLSDAWRQDSDSVHSWRLIGPTELLDLRRLPADWYLPDFDDATWKAAEVISPLVQSQADSAYQSPIYQPRSIDLLVQKKITPTVLDSGFLSPGFVINEIAPPIKEPFDLQFTNLVTTSFTLETLISSVTPTGSISLDGNLLTWHPAGENRPDVILAYTLVAPGNHKLSFVGLPPTGITFGVSTPNINYSNLHLEQGVNAGRRILLSEQVGNPKAIFPLPSTGLNLEVDTLPAYFVLDLGRTIHGRVQASVTGPAGSIIDIGWDERLYPGTKRPMPYPGTAHSQWNQVDSWILDGRERVISTIDTRAGRYILFAIWGTGPVRLDDIVILEERYSSENPGSFLSSDPVLNRIWQVGTDTLIPNRTDAYTDTPWRERGQWWGDAYVASHIDQVVSGDFSLMKRGLRLMTDEFNHTSAPGLSPNGNGTHMLDYAMLWVLSLSDYYHLTGDREFIYQVFPVLKGFLEHLESFENSTTGLIDLPQSDWSKTAYVESLGYESRFGQSTALNAIYYQTLLQAAVLAEESNDAASGKIWREKAAGVRQKTNELLYLSEENSYATTLYQGTIYPPTPQSLSWALAYGLSPEENLEPLVSSLLNTLSTDPAKPNLDIYGMYWLLEALGQTGHVNEALDIINSYYGRLLDVGATTWWENFNANQNWAASYSHVWGGSPTWFLTTYVLGARMT